MAVIVVVVVAVAVDVAVVVAVAVTVVVAVARAEKPSSRRKRLARVASCPTALPPSQLQRVCAPVMASGVRNPSSTF